MGALYGGRVRPWLTSRQTSYIDRFLQHLLCMQATPMSQASSPEAKSPMSPSEAFALPTGLARLKIRTQDAVDSAAKPWLKIEPVQHGSFTNQRSPNTSLHDIKLGLTALQALGQISQAAGPLPELHSRNICMYKSFAIATSKLLPTIPDYCICESACSSISMSGSLPLKVSSDLQGSFVTPMPEASFKSSDA